MAKPGRKPKAPERIRDREIKLRLNQVESAQLHERARCARLPLAVYVRRAALGRALPRPRIVRGDAEKLAELVRLLGRSFNNFNQLARSANTGRICGEDVLRGLEEIRGLLLEVRREALGTDSSANDFGSEESVGEGS